MTALTGTINNANPGPTLYALIETAALADGWTLDDTVVIGGNTHKILKSAAAGNAQNLDWFLDINYPTTGITGGMRFAPFEGYTAASDVGLRGPFGHVSNATLDGTTYSRYGATTSALETNWLNSASATGVSMTLLGSSFQYWISITRNRIIVLTSLQTNTLFYTGFFVPSAAHAAHAGAALFPLIMCALALNTAAASTTAISTASAALTRLPKVSTVAWNASVYLNSIPGNLGMFTSGVLGTAVSEVSGAMQGSPIPILGNLAAAPGVGSTTFAHLGLLDGVCGAYVTSGAVRGDSISDGTDTWITTTASSNWALLFESI